MHSAHTKPATGERERQIQLINRLRRSEADAFEELVRTYGPRMLSVARRMINCESEAADAVQDAWLCAVRSLDSFEERSSLWTWLHRIVVNACLMKCRTKRRRPAVSLDDLLPRFESDGHHAESVRDWSPDAATRLQTEETRASVRAAIDLLPDDYRTVVLLRDVEQFDTETTAKLLDVSIAVVKTRLHRARQALRSRLESVMNEDTVPVD